MAGNHCAVWLLLLAGRDSVENGRLLILAVRELLLLLLLNSTNEVFIEWLTQHGLLKI